MLTYERYQALHAIHIRVPGEPGNEAKNYDICLSLPRDSGLLESNYYVEWYWVYFLQVAFSFNIGLFTPSVPCDGAAKPTLLWTADDKSLLQETPLREGAPGRGSHWKSWGRKAKSTQPDPRVCCSEQEVCVAAHSCIDGKPHSPCSSGTSPVVSGSPAEFHMTIKSMPNV